MFSRIKHLIHDKLAQRKIVRDVIKFGWHILFFEKTDVEVSFAYTIGLWKNYNHPEIISFGMSRQTLHGILNNAGQKIKEGKILGLNKDDNDIFETIPAQFLPIDNEYISKYFGYGMWYYKYNQFPTIQLIWSDREGKFPWDLEFDVEFHDRQPILNNQYLEKVKKTHS